MTVILDPIETAGWLKISKQNGTARAFAYGQYLAGDNLHADDPHDNCLETCGYHHGSLVLV
jgi:hypothetical protein